MRIYDRQPLYRLDTTELIRLYDYYEKRKITGLKKQALHQELHDRGYLNHAQTRGSACAQAPPPAYDFSTHTDAQLQARLVRILSALTVTDATAAQAHAIDQELKRRQTQAA